LNRHSPDDPLFEREFVDHDWSLDLSITFPGASSCDTGLMRSAWSGLPAALGMSRDDGFCGERHPRRSCSDQNLSTS
jgi:hypothetical protein